MAWWKRSIVWAEDDAQREIFDSFADAFMRTGGPLEAALFCRETHEGIDYVAADGGHPVIGVVLKAAGFLQDKFPAQVAGFGLLIGHADARERLSRK